MTVRRLQTSAEPETNVVEERPFGQTVTVHVSRSNTGTLSLWPAQPVDSNWFGLVREVVAALVTERASLAYQLSHAKGLIDDEDFAATIEHYLWEPKTSPDLDRKASMLAELVPELVEAELVSTVFRCELVDAERALARVAHQLRFPFAGHKDSLSLALIENRRAGR